MLKVLGSVVLIFGVFWLVCRPRATSARALWLVSFSVVVAGGISMMVAHSFVARWGIRTDPPRDGLWAMMAGTADRPFVFRRLAPDIVRAATALTESGPPRRIADAYLANSKLLQVYSSQVMTRSQAVALHFAYLLVWISWWGATIVGAALLRSVRRCSWLEGLTSACLAICLVPLTFAAGGYLYDSVELLLATALVLCISENWLWLLPLLFGAMLVNKESALAFVPALFPLFARHLGKKAALTWCLALSAVAVLWLSFIRHKYAACHGTEQAWLIGSNLNFWSTPASYLKFAQLFSPGLLAPRGGNILILVLLLVPLRFGWRNLRQDIRHGTVLGALVMVPLFLLSGCLDETRVLCPLFPFMFVACSEGVNRLFSESASQTLRQEETH